MTLVAASSRYRAFASSCLHQGQLWPSLYRFCALADETHLEFWNACLISIDSSIIASYSDCSEVSKAGIEVWLDGLGGSVDGSVGVSADSIERGRGRQRSNGRTGFNIDQVV